MFKLKESRRQFFDRWGITFPADLPSGARADSPIVEELCGNLIHTAPGWSRATLQNTFVGSNANAHGCNVETSSFGAAFISIYPRLAILLNCCAGLQEAFSSLQNRNLDREKPRMTEHLLADLMDEAGPAWRDLAAWLLLSRHIVEADPRGLREAAQEVEARLDSAPREQQWRRGVRFRLGMQFILGHEYSHVLLGHVKGSSETVTGKAARAVRSVVETVPMNDELQCDLLGAHLGLVLPALRERESRARATRLVISTEAAGVVFMALRAAAGGILDDSEPPGFRPPAGHPEAALRFNNVADVLHRQFELENSSWTGPDVGPRGPGFSERLNGGFDDMKARIALSMSLIELPWWAE